MITFETQEDFEDAVMKVLKDRLKVELYRDNGIACNLYDNHKEGYVQITSDTVYSIL